jgi:hypothetical protein
MLSSFKCTGPSNFEDFVSLLKEVVIGQIFLWKVAGVRGQESK